MIAKIGLGLSLFCLSQVGFSNMTWVDSKTVMSLDKVLAQAKNSLHFTTSLGQTIPAPSFLAFPKRIPASGRALYASLQARSDYAAISIGSTPECQGEKPCLLGSLVFEPQRDLSIVYDANNVKITSLVPLHQGLEGYLTKEHALGSTFPAALVWRDGPITYTLSAWRLQPDQYPGLVQMANSVIDGLH